MNGVMLKKIASGYFTDMREIFDSLDQVQLGYNWLLSDYECNSYPAEMPFNQPFVWLSGAEINPHHQRSKNSVYLGHVFGV